MPAPRPGIVPLRPLGLGELLDGALQTITRHPRLTLGTAAVVAVVIELLQLPLRYALGSSLAAFSTGSATPTPDLTTLSRAAAGFSVLGLVGGIVTLLATTVLTGLLMVVVGRAVLGAPVEAADCWRAARARLGGLVGVVVLGFLIALGILVVAVLPALVVAVAGAPVAAWVTVGVLGLLAGLIVAAVVNVYLSLAAPAVVLEGVGVVAALRRSRTLVRGRFWPVVGILLLAAVITAVIGGILGIPFSIVSGLIAGDGSPFALGPLLVTSVGTVLGLTVTLPFQSAVTGLLYVDQRMRREGFDLELQRAALPGAR